MNYIILDLEATCWQDRSLKKQNEIIEIGAVKFTDGQAVGEFSKFVKPLLSPVLSAFCTELTTITQVEIDTADAYPIVIQRFQEWINLQEPYVLCSWGFYDKNQFLKDDQLHGLNSDWLKNHISLKHQYASIHSLKRPIGMGGALKQQNLSLDGTHHRGIDDARNIAKLFQLDRDKWELPNS